MDYPLSRRAFLALGAGSLTLAGCVTRAQAAPTTRGRRRALLIAVQEYERPGRKDSAKDLNTLPDVQQLEKVLRGVLKFDSVTVLDTKDQTKRQAILTALKTFLDETHPTDVLLVHYSGHGSQVLDPGDALGFDQTIVPSDYISTRDGSNDIKDKELAKLLRDGLNKRRPAAFLLTFDSCHSGTITRDGGAKKRGFERLNTLDLQALLQKRGGMISSQAIGNQGFTAISACRSDESDFETEDDRGNWMGSLTYALCKALANAKEDTTYRDLFEQITSVMRAKGLRQTPQMEGPLNVGILGGGLIEQSRYVEVKTKNETVLLEAGYLMGIREGSKVALYTAGTKNFKSAAPIAHAILRGVGPTESRLEVTYEPGTTIQKLADARAVFTELVYDEEPLRVDVSLLKSHPRRKEILDELDDSVKKGLLVLQDTGKKWDVQISPAAELYNGIAENARSVGADERWEVVVRPAGQDSERSPRRVKLRGADPTEKNTLVLLRGDGTLLSSGIVRKREGKRDEVLYLQSLANDADLAGNIRDALTRETRHRLLTQLPEKPGGGSAHIEYKIIRCAVEKDSVDPSKVHWKDDIEEIKPGKGSQMNASIGEFFRVELRNTGEEGMHVTIADLSPDGSIGALWPNAEIAKVDNLVPPKSKWLPLMADEKEYAVWVLTEPTGSEIFMAIATPEPADFSPLFDVPTIGSRGVPGLGERGGREALTPLGKLLLNSSTRNASSANAVPSDWQAIPIHLNVLETGK